MSSASRFFASSRITLARFSANRFARVLATITLILSLLISEWAERVDGSPPVGGFTRVPVATSDAPAAAAARTAQPGHYGATPRRRPNGPPAVELPPGRLLQPEVDGDHGDDGHRGAVQHRRHVPPLPNGILCGTGQVFGSPQRPQSGYRAV